MTLKTLFPRAMEVAYLDTAAEGLPTPGCSEAFSRYCRDKTLGTPGRRFLWQTQAETLEMAARLLKTEPNNVAFVSNASEALYILAASIEWNSGDEVVIAESEFPSNISPWVALRNRGVRVIVAPVDEGAMRWETIAECITSRTRLVSLSLVSYKTGAYLTGIPELSSEVKRAGAHLSIDATQALGRCPVSLDGVDYLMGSSFKWLMGPHGLGLVYLSPEFGKHLRPVSLGWYSVANAFASDRFETCSLKPGAACLSAGMPNFPSLYALHESLKFLLGIKVEAIYEELQPLVERLRSGFEGLGCDMLTPNDLSRASGIVAFGHSRADEIGLALQKEGVVVWGGDGRVRASVHLYNDIADIEHCLTALDSILRQRQPVGSGRRD